MKLIWITMICSSFTEIFDNPSSAHEISKKSQHTSWAVQSSSYQEWWRYVTYLSNVVLIIMWLTLLEFLKVKFKPTLQFEEKVPFRNYSMHGEFK
jgi:hypothetical protein